MITRQKASPIVDFSLLLFRLGCGLLLLLSHGWSNAVEAWNYVWKDQPWSFIDQLAAADYPFPVLLASGAAAICAVLPASIVLGFLTRICSGLILIVLVMALVAGSQLGAAGQEELILLYILAFGLLFLQGGGAFGIDSLFYRKKRSRQAL